MTTELTRKQINTILSSLEALFNVAVKGGHRAPVTDIDEAGAHIERLRELVVMGDSSEAPPLPPRKAALVLQLRQAAARWRKTAGTRPMRKTVTGEICKQLAIHCDLLAELAQK